MKKGMLSILFIISASFNAAAITQFKPAVLNAALLFEHDATTGNVKNSTQWIRDLDGKLQAMMDVKYDSSGCFTEINMIDKVNNQAFHILNKNGVITSSNGKFIAGKVNKACEVTELQNDEGDFVLNYNVRGLLESIVEAKTGDIVSRYEYRNGQFPVRIKHFKKGLDYQFSFPYGSDQFMDLTQTVFINEKFYYMTKQSCSYTTNGNVDKCSLIMSTNNNYRNPRTFWITNHLNEYY